MTLTSEEQQLIDDLKTIVSERLRYSNTWNNVRLKIRKTYLEIIWFDSKFFHDPRGVTFEERRRIKPFTVSRIADIVERQLKDLLKDEADFYKSKEKE